MPQSIEGGVVVINTLSTKNNGDYPLVMAESVEMENGKNVEDEINEITENISGIINDTDINQNSTWSSKNIIEKLSVPFEDSGDIVFYQPIEGTLLNIMVDIERIQEGEGDPSPDNVRPIRGWDTVNVWRGGRNLIGGDLVSKPSPIGRPTDSWGYITETLPTGEYIWQAQYSGTDTNAIYIYLNVLFEDGSISDPYYITTLGGKITNYASVSLEKPGKLFVYSAGVEGNIQETSIENLQKINLIIEPKSNSTNYEPYRGKTFTIALGQTVYGGTLDVTTGVLTVTHIEHVEDGSGNFNVSFLPTLVFDFLPEELKGVFGSRIISNMFGTANNLSWGSASSRQISLNITDTPLAELSTNEEFKSYFKGLYDAGNPATFVYELANPVTIQLTPTEIYALSGVNTIYADAGDITVSGYPAFRTLPVPTSGDEGKVLTVVGNEWVAMNPGYESKNWEYVQKIVRMGLAPQYFPVGYEFVTHDSTEDTDIIWRVVGYDTIKAADESLSHTMILETKYVYSISSAGTGARRCFDEKEAIYYAEEELAPGTYCITIPANYGETVDTVETSVSFTLTQPVPAGGVIVYDLPIAITISDKYRMKTYLNQMSATSIEEVSVSVGVNGTSLGVADGSVQNVNYCDRAIGGSSNYAQSAIRQLLNSSADAGEFWTPQTRFDMVPSWHGEQPGMMARFPADFLAVVQPAIVKYRTNKIYEIDSLDGTVVAKDQVYALHDRFFLLSGVEIYGTGQGADQELGEMLEFYDGLTNTEKIKYDAVGSSHFSWLRDAAKTTTYKCRYISGVTGGLAGSNASYTNPSFTVACIIA